MARSKCRSLSLWLVAAVIGISASARVAHAEEATESKNETSPPIPTEGPRTMRGHTFPRPVSDDSAFLPTTVGFRQGLLFVDGGDVSVGGLTKPIQKVAALESLDLAVRVVDWLAVAANADLQAQLGASELALFGTASHVAGSVRFGPAFRIARIRSSGTQISIRPYHQQTFGALLDVSHVIPVLQDRLGPEASSPPGSVSEASQRAKALGNELLRSAVTPLRRSAWGASIHVAQTIVPQVGVQFSYNLKRERFVASPYDVTRGQLPDEYFVSLTHVASAAISFDARSFHVPIAVMFETAIAGGSLRAEATDQSAGLDTTVLVGSGLYYSGRRTLQVGFHAALERGLSPIATPLGRGQTPSAYYGQFALRYFFDSVE